MIDTSLLHRSVHGQNVPIPNEISDTFESRTTERGHAVENFGRSVDFSDLPFDVP